MGQPTNAILCYGIDIGDPSEGYEGLTGRGFLDDVDTEDDDFDLEKAIVERLLQAAGFTEPDPYPYREDRDRTPDEREAHTAWYRRRGDAEKALPVELVTHCSSECPMHILAARPVYTAYRGNVKRLTSPMGRAGGHDGLVSAMEALGWVPVQPPTWLLVSYWG